MDKISILGFVIVETLRKKIKPRTRANRSKIVEIQKIQCQLSLSTINPENVGPTAGANIITSPIIPIAVPRLLGGKMTKIVLVINGSNRAVPIAWMTRANNKISKLGVIAATIEPIIEKSRDVIKSCRVVNHCSSNAETGTKIPKTNKYPVVSHCTSAGSTENSVIMFVKAIFKAVSLNKPIKAANIKAANIGTGLISLDAAFVFKNNPPFVSIDQCLSFT